MKKIIVFIMVIVTLLCATACNKENNQSHQEPEENKKPEIRETVEENQMKNITGTLHKINVKDTDKIFISSDGKTEYKIVYPGEEFVKEQEASNSIYQYIFQATQVAMKVVESSEAPYTDSAKYIYINCEKQFSDAGLTMVSDNIGDTGFYIKSKGNSVFIMANHGFGVNNGGLTFLSHVIGFDPISEDTIHYTKSKGEEVNLPEFDVVEKPDYEYYIPGNKIDKKTASAMRYLDESEIFAGWMWHTSFNALSPTKYGKSHPLWYSTDKHEPRNNRKQLCYTSHGNAKEFDLMTTEIVKNMIVELDRKPDANNILLTIEDSPVFCDCDACTHEREKYGTNSAVVIKLCNIVSEKLDKHYREVAEAKGKDPRQVKVVFFGYFTLEKPPVKIVNGQYKPIDDDIVLNKNVVVYIPPIYADYTKSFYDEANKKFAENIKGWGVVADTIYIWCYETNFTHYLYPYNSYRTMFDSFKFFKENGANFIFPQGQYNQAGSTGFVNFRTYMNSKCLWDVNFDYNGYKKKFFDNYFSDASQPMMKFFDEMQIHLYNVMKNNPVDFNEWSIYSPTDKMEYWPKQTIECWMRYIDEAYKSIEKYKTTDKELYTKLYNHINLESIFPRYVLIDSYGGYYSAEKLQEMKKDFKNDCNALEITNYGEHTLIDSVFSKWGI